MSDEPADLNGLSLAVARAVDALERAQVRFNAANDEVASAASALQRALVDQMDAEFKYRAAKDAAQ